MLHLELRVLARLVPGPLRIARSLLDLAGYVPQGVPLSRDAVESAEQLAQVVFEDVYQACHEGPVRRLHFDRLVVRRVPVACAARLPGVLIASGRRRDRAPSLRAGRQSTCDRSQRRYAATLAH
jgi:hypothetical protein